MIYPINQNDPREQILALEEMFVDAVENTVGMEELIEKVKQFIETELA